MDYLKEIVLQIELHSVEGIRSCFENGINPNDSYNGRPLIEELISEYTRSSRFKDCVNTFVKYGLQLDDRALLAVLQDDDTTLERLIVQNPGIIGNTYSFRCAYTPFENVSLLHICAEFNHVACAGVLVRHHADVNVTAGTDEYGFGGQTPIFHTVNQNGNHSKSMLEFLLPESADLGITVRGIIWGKGYDWETLIPAVNPISYSMMGLLPQMHRNEKQISETVSLLLKEHYKTNYIPQNIPNAYLHKHS